MDERDRREEELFTRAPLTKMEKKREKYLKKSRYGYENFDSITVLLKHLMIVSLSSVLTHFILFSRMGGVTDSFFDEVKSMPLGGADDEQPTSFGSSRGGMRKYKKRKVCISFLSFSICFRKCIVDFSLNFGALGFYIESNNIPLLSAGQALKPRAASG